MRHPIDHGEDDETATTTTTTTTTTTPTATTTSPRSIKQQKTSNETTNSSSKISEAQLDRLNTLIKTIRQGSYNKFTELLSERHFKSLLNVYVNGHTALHYSLIYGRSQAWCEQLISNGANPNLATQSGWHPVHLATFNCSRDTMQYLIECLSSGE